MTLPFWGFSLAVSGRTRPLAVVSSSSIARTIRRSPRGLSFITYDLRRERSRDRIGTHSRRVPITAREYRSQSMTVKVVVRTSVLAAILALACGPSAPAKVVTIAMENREASTVLGSRDAPYVNALARRYAVARASYGITH